MTEETGYGWTLGAVLMGVFINTYLFGVTSYQYIIYFTTEFSDPYWIRGVVISLLVVDAFHSCSMLYIPWFLCVKNYNNPSMLGYPVWAYLLTPTLDSTSGFITQVFLAIRIYRLVKNKVAFGTILALAIVAFIFGIAVGIRVWWMSSIAEAATLRYLCVPWLVFQAVADAAISATLSWYFWHTRTGNRQTDWAMNTLFHKALQTGLPAAVVAIVVLATYVQFGTQTSNLFATFSFPHGRIYTLTLLDTLIVRTKLRRVMKKTDVSLILDDFRQAEASRTNIPEHVELKLVRLTSTSAFKNVPHSPAEDDDERKKAP